MSDNQSDNSYEWASSSLVGGGLSRSRRNAPTVDTHSLKLAEAKMRLEDAQQELWRAEHALEDARAAFTKAQAELQQVVDPIKWRQVLCPIKVIAFSELIELAAKSGHKYVLHHGKVYRAENGEDTGVREEDVQ